MTEQQIKDTIQGLKKSFRLEMNGPVSQSMREKGLEYKINWGVPFIQLKQMAKEHTPDYHLAIALWKEDIRECKILATLLMPHEDMPEEVAEIWMEQTLSQEMAEMQAFNLYQHVGYAPKIAYRWMASDNAIRQICAYNIIARLFMKGQEPNERGINEFLDQAMAAMHSTSAGVRHAATNAMTRFADMGIVYERLAKSALKREGLQL